MMCLLMGLVIHPTVPARDGPVRTFGLDVMVQLVLGTLEMTALVLMETMVILLAVMGHHEKILFIRIDG